MWYFKGRRKKYNSPYTGKEVDAAVAKGGALPDVTSANKGNLLGVTAEGKIAALNVGDSNIFVVSYTQDEPYGTATMSASWNEFMEAYNSGKLIVPFFISPNTIERGIIVDEALYVRVIRVSNKAHFNDGYLTELRYDKENDSIDHEYTNGVLLSYVGSSNDDYVPVYRMGETFESTFESITKIYNLGTNLDTLMAAADTNLNTPIFFSFTENDMGYDGLKDLIQQILTNEVNGRPTAILSSYTSSNLFLKTQSTTSYVTDEIQGCLQATGCIEYSGGVNDITMHKYTLFIKYSSAQEFGIRGFIKSEEITAQAI